MTFLRLHGLRKTFPDGTQAVQGLDLDIERGEFVVLLGPSGCGKTTTLRMVAGLEMPSEGGIELAGRPIEKLKPSERDAGFVFQFFALYPHMTVRQNIAFPLQNMGMKEAQIAEVLERTGERLGLKGLFGRFPAQLSGGDRQRVALARALVRRPALFLMDEPIGTLDANLRLSMREFIREQQQALQVTTLYVTHDQEEAMALADRIVVMEGGRIRQVGSPGDIYQRPACLFTAHFVGSPGMNLWRGEALIAQGKPGFRATPDGPILHPGGPLPSPGPIVLGIRCENLKIGPTCPHPARLIRDEFLGAFRYLHLDTPWGKAIARIPGKARLQNAETIRWEMDEGGIRYFDGLTRLAAKVSEREGRREAL